MIERIDGAVKAVGSWFIWTKTAGMSSRLIGLEAVASFDEHDLLVPAPASDWIASDPL
ncbi:hypothetical protein HPO96_05515 [Kribbella sandramycini]|uniref:Uncharacterized protein n=1 Tax=Kribbella sandramycini TaxID=60450 RepID=A0A7Y4KW00_9ACTN|nr:hypothetical protein [Kribbella sandramycini]MBB6567702.1 hypothetical protein [Kribbella sandramycini]NOL39697.1 hypothetical protein [Kribbella sandramycini]